MVHEVAAAGFNDPADYEAARPSYPPDAVAWIVEHLHLAPGTRTCDLAAGTGKLTRLLVGSGTDLIAAEPVPGMRATFQSVQPDIPVVAATAEALPFKENALDAMTVAQAWHWFDAERASREAARVLKPGARLALVWNARDRSEPWVDAVWTIMDRVEKRAPWRDHENWRDSALIDMPGFGPIHDAQFFHRQEISREGVLQRMASVSHVAVLPPAEREAVLDEVRVILATHPSLQGVEVLTIPYRVDCFWTEHTGDRA
jgi:SAM-dependent methyltransferase